MANNNAGFESAKGNISIEMDVIARIAGIIATGCYGVVGMAHRSKSDEFAALLKKDTLTKGIRVTCTPDKKLRLDIHVIVEYGVNINTVSNSVIQNVTYQLNHMTGLTVERVNVFVEGFRVQE
ncbi:MAG: Asp23/Gls24 family envelope stress response protein [Ruminococcaceae bacterium]|nr:Asp23/Gls24 family envelope stress response protein [Oscillospiraceae bacterium]